MEPKEKIEVKYDTQFDCWHCEWHGAFGFKCNIDADWNNCDGKCSKYVFSLWKVIANTCQR